MNEMIKSFCCAIFCTLAAAPVFAEGEAAGDFDYYVLSLSWTPSWCAEAGDDQDAPSCDTGAGYGFSVHGLWPQYEDGWPSYCITSARDPSRGQTNAMADIMGSGGAAWYQWKKHGRCARLGADGYFEAVRTAYDSIVRPDVFRQLPDDGVALPASVVEAAFLESNPNLSADGVTVTCKEGRIQEVRICLDKELNPRACSGDVRWDCLMNFAEMPPVR